MSLAVAISAPSDSTTTPSVGMVYKVPMFPAWTGRKIVKTRTYGPLFSEETVAWLHAESHRYELDEQTEDSIRWAKALAVFRCTRHARVVGLGG